MPLSANRILVEPSHSLKKSHYTGEGDQAGGQGDKHYNLCFLKVLYTRTYS